MAFDSSDVKFLNDNIRDTVSPATYTSIDISIYFRNNNIRPTLETVIECIIRLQASRHRNFCNPAIVRVRELILLSISPKERDDYEDLVNQVLARLTPAPSLPQTPAIPTFSVSREMLEGFDFCPYMRHQEQKQEYNSAETLNA
ncbi:5846_t:CDS:1, partial [Dentiscutata erythropus]